METKEKRSEVANINVEVSDFFGKLFSFNTSLKLFHWHVTGKASYAQHMAIDQALEDLSGDLDRIVETSYALYGDLNITVPEAKLPVDIICYVSNFYDYVDSCRDLFGEAFTQAILDDIQEAIQQLLYRLKRLL